MIQCKKCLSYNTHYNVNETSKGELLEEEFICFSCGTISFFPKKELTLELAYKIVLLDSKWIEKQGKDSNDCIVNQDINEITSAYLFNRRIAFQTTEERYHYFKTGGRK